MPRGLKCHCLTPFGTWKSSSRFLFSSPRSLSIFSIILLSKMLNIDSKPSNIPEVSLLLISTYLAIKGTTAPHLAEEKTRAKSDARTLLRTELNPDLRKKFIASNLICIVGALLRLKCYSVLKEFFTFKLAVKENHKIIDSGPYAVVRHPSYTAVKALVLGAQLVHILYNPYLIESRPNGFIRSNAKKILIGLTLFEVILIHLRMKDEEQMLSSDPQIGSQYRAYMKKVQYRLIPGIY